MRNSENHTVQRDSFIGIERNVDPLTLPNGKFLDGHDIISSDVLGTARTRDGYAPVVDSVYTDAFKIMGGARGRLWTPPWLNAPPITGDIVVDDEFALKISYSPNKDLYVNSGKPLQPVTFFVYGGEELGISGDYSWDFGDGGTSVGTALSVNHDYSAAGTYAVTVSGGGYTESAQVKVESRPVPVDPGTPGVPGDGSTSPLAGPEVDIKVNGSDGPVDISAAGDVTVTWTSKNSDYVEVDGERKSSSGSMTKAIPAQGRIIYADAFKGAQVATDVVTVTVDGELDDSVGTDRMSLKIDMPLEVFSGDSVAAIYTLVAKTQSGDQQLFPVDYTGNLSALHVIKGKMSSNGAGGVYGETLAFADESSVSNSDTIQFDLDDGVDEAVAEVVANLVVAPAVGAVALVLVKRKSHDFIISVIGSVLSPEEYDLSDGETAELALSIKAVFTGTDIVDTSYSSKVQLVGSITANAGDGNDELSITAIGCYGTDEPDPLVEYNAMPSWIIPADVWQDGDKGYCSVGLVLTLPDHIGSWPALMTYQDITFSAVEVSNG